LPKLKSILKVETNSLIKSCILSIGAGNSSDDSFKFLYYI
jgi:hypothetical protein